MEEAKIAAEEAKADKERELEMDRIAAEEAKIAAEEAKADKNRELEKSRIAPEEAKLRVRIDA